MATTLGGRGRDRRASGRLVRRAIGPVALLPVALAAQDSTANPVTFTGNVGFVNTAGNTSVTSLTIGEKLTARAGKGLFTQTAALISGRTSGTESANSRTLRGRLDYPLQDRLTAYVFGGYERNRFAGISRRLDQVAGVAYQAVETPRDSLDVEAGCGMVQELRYALPGSSLTSSNDFASARAAATYKHLFGQTSNVQLVVEYLPDLRNSSAYRIHSESTLAAVISTHLALTMSDVIRYNNAPPTTDLMRSDRTFTSGLQVTY